MKASDIPDRFPIPFGDSAGGSFIRTIPVTTADPDAASLELGFPPDTFTPIGAGGEPPDGRDMNGILNEITAWSRWQGAGGTVPWDSAFSTAIGGYPKGALVSSTPAGSFWLCTADDNTTNPDSAGAGWQVFPTPTPIIGSGQCYLSLSGSNLLLLPYNGNQIVINGVSQVIPSFGVTLAPGVLTPGTLYYIYAYMNTGVMTLEASVTGRSVDPNTGVQIKTGDVTRSLVGMARPITGPAWVNSAAQRFVASWYNLKATTAINSLQAPVATTSNTIIELSSTARAEFLTWANVDVILSLSLWGVCSLTNGNLQGAVWLDGAAAGTGLNGVTANAGSNAGTTEANVSIGGVGVRLTEGYHYVSPAGETNTGSTGTFRAGSSAQAVVQQ